MKVVYICLTSLYCVKKDYENHRCIPNIGIHRASISKMYEIQISFTTFVQYAVSRHMGGGPRVKQYAVSRLMF